MNSNALIGPELLASAVKSRLVDSSAEISAYWMQVAGDRDRYAQELRSHLSGHPVVVFVVREALFDNPNSILADLIDMLNRNRGECEERLVDSSQAARFGVVLLSRTSLSVPQASSPVTLPVWFPKYGGYTVATIIEDITWSAEVAVSTPEAKIDEICEALYNCEGAFLRRLKAAHVSNHNFGNSFMELMRRNENEKYAALLSQFQEYHDGVTSTSAFRPSVREGKSLVGRLWGLFQCTSPDGLYAAGKAVAGALAVPGHIEIVGHESFAAVLSRPAVPNEIPSHRFCRNLLITVASSCRFITAAAHADEYANYPVPLLISFSYDLRRSLLDGERILNMLED